MRIVRNTPRFVVALGLIAVGVIGSFVLLSLDARETASQQSNFMGGSPSILDLEGVQLLRLEFPAGVRSNWHTHVDGQLLMVEEGRSLTQERGRPVREMQPGEPWYTPAGVEHWHGASPEEAVVQWTIYGGDVNWLDPVTDDQYLTPAGR